MNGWKVDTLFRTDSTYEKDIVSPLLVYWELFYNPQGHDLCVFNFLLILLLFSSWWRDNFAKDTMTSCLIRIVLQLLGARPLNFWCFVEILLWGVMPIHGQYIFLWICLAQLSLVLSGMIYGLPWFSLRLNIIFVFPLWLDQDGLQNIQNSWGAW